MAVGLINRGAGGGGEGGRRGCGRVSGMVILQNHLREGVEDAAASPCCEARVLQQR